MEVGSAVDPAQEQAQAQQLQQLQQRAQQLLAVQRCIHLGLHNPQRPAQRALLQHLSREAQAEKLAAEARGGCDFRAVLRLGDHVSATLFAPPSWRPPPPAGIRAAAGTGEWHPPARLVGGFPPAPQPENMQKGLLGTFSVRFSSSSVATSSVAADIGTATTSAGATSVATDTTTGNLGGGGMDVSEYERKEPPSQSRTVTTITSTTTQNNINNHKNNDDSELSPAVRPNKRPRSPPAASIVGSSTEKHGAGGNGTRQQSALGAPGASNEQQQQAQGQSVDSGSSSMSTSNTTKKSRTININFGFESDSDEDEED